VGGASRDILTIILTTDLSKQERLMARESILGIMERSTTESGTKD
jgi:hypothetical protein